MFSNAILTLVTLVHTFVLGRRSGSCRRLKGRDGGPDGLGTLVVVRVGGGRGHGVLAAVFGSAFGCCCCIVDVLHDYDGLGLGGRFRGGRRGAEDFVVVVVGPFLTRAALLRGLASIEPEFICNLYGQSGL